MKDYKKTTNFQGGVFLRTLGNQPKNKKYISKGKEKRSSNENYKKTTNFQGGVFLRTLGN